jgi:ribosomal protein S18 acetylase RimI-like enzyme
MIRPFSLSDLDSILQIESRSFPKSPYDWITFLSLHRLYPETFLVYLDLSTPRPEASASAAAARLGPSRASGSSDPPKSQAGGLRVYPEQRLPPHTERWGLGAVRKVTPDHGQKEEKVLGYIVFSQDGHIISIAVHPQHRKKGIGTQLLQKALKTSHSKKVWAEVRRSNQGAQTFYFKMGFQITGMVPNYYGNEDALIIQRTLDIPES